MEIENCYFYVEGDTEEEKRMRCMCLECSKSNQVSGWFYDAKSQGYGPFEYKCAKCARVIYKHPESERNEANN